MRISDWSSDLCSSDLSTGAPARGANILRKIGLDDSDGPSSQDTGGRPHSPKHVGIRSPPPHVADKEQRSFEFAVRSFHSQPRHHRNHFWKRLPARPNRLADLPEYPASQVVHGGGYHCRTGVRKSVV